MVPVPRAAALRFIGLFELTKGCVLVGVGLELWRLGHEGAAAALIHWATRLHFNLHGRYFGPAVEWIAGLDEQRLQVVNAGLLAYGALFLIEGAGLVLRHRWAECVALAVTASIILLELFEIAWHPDSIRVGVALVNAAIVWYLVRRVRRPR